MKNVTQTIHIVIFILILPWYLSAQESIDPYSIEDSLLISDDIFSHEYPAEITLKFDIKKYQRNKWEDKYLPAELTYHMADSFEDVHHKVRIRARGRNRREVCSFPPIRLNIKKADIRNELLQETKNLKIVTHCFSTQVKGQTLLKEFLAYKIYNIISPYSFRVRLIKMNYIDIGRKNKETNTWAFMIEPEGMMAERLDMLPLKVDHLGLSQTDTVWTNMMTIFQYMIGNADYSITGRYNIKLLKPKKAFTEYAIPVPYDFDYSGFVNASYAIPGETLGISSVRERYFLGPCRNPEDYQKTIDAFQSMKKDIYDLVNSFSYLSERERKASIRYLDEFFNGTNSRRYIENYILSTCR